MNFVQNDKGNEKNWLLFWWYVCGRDVVSLVDGASPVTMTSS